MVNKLTMDEWPSTKDVNPCYLSTPILLHVVHLPQGSHLPISISCGNKNLPSSKRDMENFGYIKSRLLYKRVLKVPL